MRRNSVLGHRHCTIEVQLVICPQPMVDLAARGVEGTRRGRRGTGQRCGDASPVSGGAGPEPVSSPVEPQIYINIDLEAVVMWAMPQIPAGGACFQTLRPVLGDTTKQMFSK